MDTCGRILLEATVTSVGEGPYYYPACKLCYSKLIETGDDPQIFACFKCNRTYPVSETNQRYRLCLTISDGLTLANITAFGNMLAPYFGCSASELRIKWDRLLKKTEYQMDSGLLKCALEQTMVGSSLLFGFKGVVKKPKGARIFLKDVAHSGETKHSQYLGRSKELIAVQIVPQCKSQYPIPVIHHLQKLDHFIQGQETCISSMQFKSESLLHTLPHDSFLNDSPYKKDDTSLPMEKNNNSSHMESDLSNSVSGIDSKLSIGFSMTCSSENSYLVTRDGSMLNSLEINDSAMSGSRPQRSQLKQDCIINGQTPVSSRKSSWCVRNWLLKHKNCSKLKQSNESSSTGTCDISVNSPNFFSPPEQPRHQPANDCSSDALSLLNFSAGDIVMTPTKYESNHALNSFKTHKTQSEILNRYLRYEQQISENVTRESNFLKPLTSKDHSLKIQGCLPCSQSPCKENINKRYLLTLKSRKEVTQIFKDNHFDNERTVSELEIGIEDTVTDKPESEDTVTDQVPLMDMPESEDFDCFLANVETLDSEHLTTKGSPTAPAVSMIEGRNHNNDVDTGVRGCSQIQNLSSHFGAACGIDKSIVNFEDETRSDFSFIDMPESEDMALFLFAANLSEMMKKEGSNKQFDDITREKQFSSRGITKCSDALTALPKQGNEEKENGTDTHKTHGRDFIDCQISFEDMLESKEFDISPMANTNLDGDPPICLTNPAYSTVLDVRTNVINNCDLMPAIEVERNFEEKLNHSTDYVRPQKCERDLNVQLSFDNMPESEEFDLFLAAANLDTNLQISDSNPAEYEVLHIERNVASSCDSMSVIEFEMEQNFDKLKVFGSCNNVYNNGVPISIPKIFDEKSLNKNECGSYNNCLKNLPSVGLGNVATCVTKRQISSFSNNSKDTNSKHMDKGDSENIFPQPQAIQEYGSNNNGFNNSFDLFSSPIPTHCCGPLTFKKDTLGDINLNVCSDNDIALLNQAEQNNYSEDTESNLDMDLGDTDSGSIFSQPQAIQQTNSNDSDFNNSFDLFSSPVPTQCCGLFKKVTLGDIDLNFSGEEDIALLNQAEQNNKSQSLFSFSAGSSSSREFVVPLNTHEVVTDRCVSSTPFHTHRYLQTSHFDNSNIVNYSADLFSPDLKTPRKWQRNGKFTSNNFSSNLFSSPDINL